VIVELAGLQLHGYHGVHPEERERGQTFLFDVELDVGERGSSDRLEDAVDYSEVARCVEEISGARAYNLLEALAAAVADALVRRFSPERVVVRVRKPEVRPGGVEVEHAAVTVMRP
jgi:dihydroneopterin aldolase